MQPPYNFVIQLSNLLFSNNKNEDSNKCNLLFFIYIDPPDVLDYYFINSEFFIVIFLISFL